MVALAALAEVLREGTIPCAQHWGALSGLWVWFGVPQDEAEAEEGTG